jgi:hypothetical protein
MNPADNLERAIEKLHVTTKAETDKHILNEAFVALRAAATLQPAGVGARLWQTALTSRVAGPVAVAAVITVGFALFFGTLGEKSVTVGDVYGTLGKVENINVARFEAGKTEPYQQVWTSQTFKVKVLKTVGDNRVRFALWDIPNRVKMISYLSVGPVQTEAITGEMLAALEASMAVPAGVVPFADAAEIPEDAQWNRLDEPGLTAVVPGARVYELAWRQEGPAPGAATFRKWRVFVDRRGNLPRRAESYVRFDPEQEYTLETFAVVTYPAEGEIQELVRDKFGPLEYRSRDPGYMGTPGAER